MRWSKPASVTRPNKALGVVLAMITPRAVRNHEVSPYASSSGVTGWRGPTGGVAQISNLLYRRIPFCRARTAMRWQLSRRPADWKSAIRQIGNLRYLPGNRRTWRRRAGSPPQPFLSPLPSPFVPLPSAGQCFRQPHPETVIPEVNVPDADEADAALEALLELLCGGRASDVLAEFFDLFVGEHRPVHADVSHADAAVAAFADAALHVTFKCPDDVPLLEAHRRASL